MNARAHCCGDCSCVLLPQVCIEALSINLDKRQLDLCSRNIGSLQSKVRECVVPTITGLPGGQAALTWHRIRLCWYVCSPG